MISVALCALAFVAALFASLRSLLGGVSVVLTVGYAYGIVRANLVETASHFIFDAAIAGLFLGRLIAPRAGGGAPSGLSIWVAVLVAWPLLLVAVPLQDILVQLVGFRANAFLLPAILIGAQLLPGQITALAHRVALLNCVAFAFAAVEYFIGIGRFYPFNPNTALIYLSADVAGGFYRIPAIFVNAHAYAGTMVMTLPLLVGTLARRHDDSVRRVLLYPALAATLLGVFMAASRTHTIAAGAILVAAFLSRRLPGTLRLAGVAGLLIVAGIVSTQPRMQRFLEMRDSAYVTSRFTGSVNTEFLDLIQRYPLGNGLGGGGTSMPYFLQSRVRIKDVLENEYARILLEQGILGLALWAGFIAWLTLRRFFAAGNWTLTRHLAWVATTIYFALGATGTGMLTSIPQTGLLLLLAGVQCGPRPEPLLEEDPDLEYDPEAVPAS